MNSGGYIPRRDASRSISTALHRPCFRIYQIRWIKKCRFINGHNFFFWNFREATRHFSFRSHNSEYICKDIPSYGSQSKRAKIADLVNTKQWSYWLFMYFCCLQFPRKQKERKCKKAQKQLRPHRCLMWKKKISTTLEAQCWCLWIWKLLQEQSNIVKIKCHPTLASKWSSWYCYRHVWYYKTNG